MERFHLVPMAPASLHLKLKPASAQIQAPVVVPMSVEVQKGLNKFNPKFHASAIQEEMERRRKDLYKVME